MFEVEKKEIIKAGMELKDAKLISLSGGNVSMRVPGDRIVVSPSGMAYETMTHEDVILMDMKGNIIEGKRRPSVDTEALLHIFNNMTRVNAVIHTHQPYATAIGSVYNKIPKAVTTLANAVAGVVNVAPFSSAASLQMGIETVEHIGDANAIILKNHGVITVGDSLKQALYAAVYMEDAVKTFVIAKTIGDPELLTDAQYDEAIEVFKDYGQKK